MTAILRPGVTYGIAVPEEEETVKVQVHKVTIGIIDHDGLGVEDLRSVLQNTHYANRCISPRVLEVETKEVDWHDRHPLNITTTQDEAFRQLFDNKTAGKMTVVEASRAIQEVFRYRSTYVDLQWPKIMIDGRCTLDDLREVVRIMELTEEA